MLYKRKTCPIVSRDDRCRATNICMHIRMMKTHCDTPENVNFEVQKSMITSYEAVSEQTINVYIFYFYMS